MLAGSMRILLLSAYDAVSHRYWRKGLVEQFPEHDWTVLTLPDRFFNWRFRGNSLSWAVGHRETLEQEWDHVIVTSMVDLSSLRGMVPSLGQVPTTVYFHENQFAYPRSGHQSFSPVEQQLQTIYTALCGDKLVFNTQYNLETFLKGAAALLKKLPDHVPDGVMAMIQSRCQVVPVPLAEDVPKGGVEKTADAPLLISWAARWEYDKGPDRLLTILRGLESSGVNYQLCLLGQSFRKSPKEFGIIEQEFQHRLQKFGFAESRQEYLQWLQQSDILLSTSRHEFQGISVLEGVACGAVPVLPDDQSYPCLFDAEYLYQNENDAVQMMVRRSAQKLADQLKAPDVTHMRWSAVRPKYQTVIGEMMPSLTG